MLGVIAVALSTSIASAQVKDTTGKADTAKKTLKHRAGVAKSEVRIPVQKTVTEQGGEVAPMNQDSIDRANFVRDSLAAAERERQEAVARAERERQEAEARAERDRLAAIAAAERAREDSIARAEEARRLREHLGRYGFYWGLAAGATLPTSTFQNAYQNGFNVTAPLGWDYKDSPFGIRGDVAYDVMNGKSLGSASITQVKVASLNLDAKLRMRLPLFSYLDRFYLVGGGGLHRVWSNGGQDPAAVTTGSTNNGFETSFNSASTNFGWNAGAGMSFGFGRSALFVESRYFDHGTGNSYMSSARFVPIILGLTF